MEQLNLVSEKGQRNAPDEKVIRNEIVCRHGRCCVHTKKGRSYFRSKGVATVSVNVDENASQKSAVGIVVLFLISPFAW